MKILHALAALALSGATLAQPLGTAFTYQGQLTESGQPASGLYDLQICVFDSPSNPVAIACAPDFDDVPVEAGVFALTLDFGAAPFGGQQRFLELRVRPGANAGGYAILAPRQVIRPAPEALRSNVSSAAPWAGLTGVPAGFADGVDNDSGGTVTGITAGPGLSGGTITGSGSIGIANGGVGLAQINTAQVQARIGSGCTVGQFVRAVNADGSVVCGSDATGGSGTVTSVIAGTGLSGGVITGSGTIAIANGGVGLAQINSAQVQARITSVCAIGQYVRGVNANGSVLCESVQAYLGINLVTTVDDPANNVGFRSSLAIGADGLPVISYLDDTADALKVARCNNAACTGAATVTTVDDPVNSVGFGGSIAIGVDSLPVISYGDFTAGALKVARCNNAACTGAATITTVDDPANNVGRDSSIAIGADGLPVISYFDQSEGNLKVARCNNPACTGAATITTVDNSANNVGSHSSIAIGADGLPVISYYDFTARALKVARCNNPACTGAATITIVDDPANEVGSDSSIAIGADGLPVISYHDFTAVSLKVARCNNPACTGAATITTVVDTNDGVGPDSSIAIGTDGLPLISYRNFTTSDLQVARCNDAACTGAATIIVVDDSANLVGSFSSIAIGADGLPVISYRDSTAGALKVAKCATRSCQ